MPRAVHRLDREHALVAALGEEHIFSEIVPVTRGFPQAAVEQQRCLNLLIAGRVETHPQVILDAEKQRPPLGVPEDVADRFLAHMKELELATEPAVIASL